MALSPSILSLLDELERVRIQTEGLLAQRDELLQELAELSSKRMDLKVQLEDELGKLKLHERPD